MNGNALPVRETPSSQVSAFQLFPRGPVVLRSVVRGPISAFSFQPFCFPPSHFPLSPFPVSAHHSGTFRHGRHKCSVTNRPGVPSGSPSLTLPCRGLCPIALAAHDPVMISGMVREQVLLAHTPTPNQPLFSRPRRNPRGQGVANILCSSDFWASVEPG